MQYPPPLNDLRGHRSRVRRAVESGDQEAALSAALDGAAAALGAGDRHSAWEFQDSAADALHAMDRYREMLDLAHSMDQAAALLGDAVLRARSLVQAAVAQRCLGRLPSAIGAARESLRLLDQVPEHADARARAYQALMASLVEDGQTSEAWDLRTGLVPLLGDHVDEQSAGKGFWTLGNLAFMVEDIERGLEYHRLASTHLSPRNDIQLWARFNKASADLQLMSGIAVEQTRDCIDRAQLAHEVMETTEMDRVGLAVTRARWGLATGNQDAAQRVIEQAISDLEDPDAAYLIPAYLVWAESLSALRPHEAEIKRAEAARIERLAT